MNDFVININPLPIAGTAGQRKRALRLIDAKSSGTHRINITYNRIFGALESAGRRM